MSREFYIMYREFYLYLGLVELLQSQSSVVRNIALEDCIGNIKKQRPKMVEHRVDEDPTAAAILERVPAGEITF